MAPSVSKEELMRNTDAVIWGLNTGTTPKLDTGQWLSNKIWQGLNSRICNIVIVACAFAEGVIVMSQLFINTGFVHDPTWGSDSVNCSQNLSSFPPYSEISPRLQNTRDKLIIASLCLVSIFMFEIILRIITGRTKFIVQGIQVFDAIIVLLAFGFEVTFFFIPPDSGAGKKGLVLIIIVRMWRIHEVLNSIISNSKAKLSHIIDQYHKEKLQSDHKVELLILKVEDLEHEVAYLKEKLKKAEKEPLFMKRRRTKDPFPNGGQKLASITINIEPNITPEVTEKPTEASCSWSQNVSTFSRKPKDKLTTFAENAAAIIVDEALLLVSHIWAADNVFVKPEMRAKAGCKLRRRPDGSIESGYGSAAGSINWNRVRETFQSEEEKKPVPLTVIRNSLRCPESSPESGYGSGGSHNQRNNSTSPRDNEAESADLSSGNSKQSGSVFLFPDSGDVGRGTDYHDVPLAVLDEATEIERVRNVEFNPYQHDKDIPMTSL